jgi:hypothetical protein
VNAINSKLILGLNFRQATDPTWAVEHAQAVEKYIGWDSVTALEIGNECDLYMDNGIRAKSYSYKDWSKEWLMYASAIYSSLNSPPGELFQGATFASSKWVPNITDFLPIATNLYSISVHNYPETNCDGHKPTMEDMLTDHSSQHEAAYLKSTDVIFKTFNDGDDFVIGEGGSASCGGTPGVSDRFGSALWALDNLFNIASVNVKNWNFHGSINAAYTTIAYNSTDSVIPEVRPQYYGLRMFAEATSYMAQIVQTDVTTTNEFIKVWATVTGAPSNSMLRIVVIHKDMKVTVNATITINIDTLGGPASLGRLLASDVYDKNGITLFGQTYDNTMDGSPIGKRQVEIVNPDKNMGYTFVVPPRSAALLTIPNVDMAEVHMTSL